MTMAFRALKASVVSLLGAAAAGRFRVVGYQPQAIAAEEASDSLRLAQVFYSGGQIPKSGGGSMGVHHDVTLKIELTTAKASKGDLAPLTNPASTPAEFAAALASFSSAADLADASLDEFVEIIYQILMDGRNIDLGLAAGTVSNRWIERIEKGDPSPRGEFVVLPGSMDLTCRVFEELLGDEGAQADPDLGAVLTEIETNVPDSAGADPAYAALRGGGI